MEGKQLLQIASAGVLLYDRSHWGLIKITGEDRLRYLHNQSTNDFNSLQPGQGKETVFITSTGRTIDLATAYVTEDAIFVLVSPNRRQQLMELLDKFIFPFDQVELTDISPDYTVFNLIGAKSDINLSKLGVEIISAEGTHALVNIAGVELLLAKGSGLAIPGYTLILPQDKATAVRDIMRENGTQEIGDPSWEILRIHQGRPYPDRELTEDYNPLEAGLWCCISFEKGCYIGQETIARLNTYQGVKQRLWGVRLHEEVAVGTAITLDSKKVGILTSYTETGSFGLAYVRTKAGGAGDQVQVGETTAELVSVPFLTHEYYR